MNKLGSVCIREVPILNPVLRTGFTARFTHFQEANARQNIWLSYILRPSPVPEMSQDICGIKYINVGRK